LEVFHKKIKPGHSSKQEHRIGAPFLGEADVVGHKSETKGRRESKIRRKLSGKKVDHGDGEGSKDQRNDTEIPFGFCKGIKLMGENEEKGRMKEDWVLFIEF
jgi:hypothetical protein